MATGEIFYSLEVLKSKLIQFSMSNKNVFTIEHTLGDGNLAFLKNMLSLLQNYGKSDPQCKIHQSLVLYQLIC
jgi:hypothetical protein